MRARHVLLYASAYLVLLVAGQASLQPGNSSPFLWPAAGVAAAWTIRSRDRRELGTALGITVVLTWAFFAVLGSGLAATLLLIIGTVAVALLPRVIMRAGRASSAPGPSRVATSAPSPHRIVVRRPQDLVLLLAGCLAGGAVSAGLVTAAAAVSTGQVTALQVTGWVLGNSTGAFIAAAAVLTFFGAFPVPGDLRRRRADELANPTGRWGGSAGNVEIGILFGATLLITVLVFRPGQTLALTFLVLVVVVWAGMRLAPAAAALAGVVVVLASLVLVLFFTGGPFASIRPPELQVIVLQSYCGVAFALTLLLSLVTTERDELSARLRHSEQAAQDDLARLRAVTDNTSEGILVVDQKGRHVFRNGVAEQLLGSIGRLDPSQHQVPLGRLHGLDGRLLRREELPMSRALSGEEIRDFFVRYRAEDGVTFALQTWSIDAVPIRRSAKGKPDRVLILIRDITASQEKVEQLEAFAGTVAHDLQGPLTGVIGWTETAVDQLRIDPGNVAELRSNLGRVDRSAHRAQELVNDLLAYSSARTSQLEFDLVDLNTMIDELTREVSEQNADLKIIITRDQIGSVRADQRMIRQVLVNLLGNAVKYTVPERPPRVHISSRRSHHVLTLEITDNGIGVPAELRRTIFEPFERGQAAGRYPGTGLGLAICAQVVRQHSGSIRVAGRPDGPGSIFTLTLADVPFEPARLDIDPADTEAAAIRTPGEISDGAGDASGTATATSR